MTQFPANWEKVEPKDENAPAVAEFYSPLADPKYSDSFAFVSLMINNLLPPYTDLTIKDLKLISSTSTTLATNPGQKAKKVSEELLRIKERVVR